MITIGAVAPNFTLPGTDGTAEGHRDYSLSEFAGASDELKQAYLVNPHDINGLRDAMLAAMKAPAKEKTRRMKAMRKQVREHDIDAWASGFLADRRGQGRRRGVRHPGPLGFYRRSVFVIDPQGVVRYAHRSTAGMTFRPADEIVAAVRAAS